MNFEQTKAAIKLPVRYDREDCLIRDANGHVLAEVCAWRYNFRNEGPDLTRTPEDGHADGQAIATALNSAESAAELEKRLRASNEVFERQLEGSKHCGNPDYECPMQDAHKDDKWEPAGALRRNLDALQGRATTWVPVENGLPTEDGHYAVTLQAPTTKFIWNTTCYWFDHEYGWCEPNREEYIPIDSPNELIAWAPLPAPYVPEAFDALRGGGE
jgi:hypothetical protein